MKTTILFLIFLIDAVSANPFVKPSQPSGILDLATNHQSKNIFPVSLYEVDGKQIIKRTNAVWLSPGKHSLKVTSIVNLSQRSTGMTTRQKSNPAKNHNTLEISVEDGKTYYIGYDASDRNPNKWKPVVWKVK